MHYAISTKVLGQTHMWYTQRQAIKLFEDFLIFMGFWILNTLKNRAREVRSTEKKNINQKKNANIKVSET